MFNDANVKHFQLENWRKFILSENKMNPKKKKIFLLIMITTLVRGIGSMLVGTALGSKGQGGVPFPFNIFEHY